MSILFLSYAVDTGTWLESHKCRSQVQVAMRGHVRVPRDRG